MLMTKGNKIKFFPYDEIEDIQKIVDSKLRKLGKYGDWSKEMIELIKNLLRADPR